jgi:hypothetical protein
MFSNRRRSPTLVDVCDFNTLYLRERNANINTKNYLSSKSPVSPLFSRNLRLVVTNGIPSNILVLPKTISSSHHKKEVKKYPKQASFDVYRSLARTSSHSERDLANDDISNLSSTFTVDRISPLSNNGFFRINHLPKIAKRNINSNETPKSPNKNPQSTPDDEYYEEEKDMITKKVLPCIPKDQTRKQLHVYMPAINC